MTGVHCLQHVYALCATDLTQDDPIRTHAESILDEFTLRDFTPALNIGRTRLKANDVILPQLQFGRILDRDDTFIIRDETGHDIEQGRFSGSSSTRDEDVQSGLNDGLQEFTDLRSQ